MTVVDIESYITDKVALKAQKEVLLPADFKPTILASTVVDASAFGKIAIAF